MTTGNSRFESSSAAARELLGAVSIRAKILGIVLALTTVLGLGITWQVRTVMNTVLLDELDSRGTSVVSDLAARSVDPILLNDTFALHELLVQTVGNHHDIVYAFVVDPEGRVIAHSFGDEGFPTDLLSLPLADGLVVYDSADGRMHEFNAPIFDGQAGTARVGMSEARLRSVIDAVTGQMVLTTLVVALCGIGAAILLTWVLTRPILDLVGTTNQVGSGDLTARAKLSAKDEIGVLAEAFNTMVADLEISQATIDAKEAARTRLLEQLITAQEEERKRIARELYDGVGQALNSVSLGISALAQAGASEQAKQLATELRELTAETLQTVRQLSRGLRPSILDDLGLAEALRHYATEFRSLYPEFRVDTHLDVATRLSPAAETTLYRMV